MSNPIPDFEKMTVDEAADWIVPLWKKHWKKPIRRLYAWMNEKGEWCHCLVGILRVEFPGYVPIETGLETGFDGGFCQLHTNLHLFKIGQEVARRVFGESEEGK